MAKKQPEGKKSSLVALVQTTMPLSFTDTPTPSTEQKTLSPGHAVNVLPTRSHSDTTHSRDVVSALQTMSREDSVFESGEEGLEKSEAHPLLHPRAPTGSECGRHGRSPVSSESDVVGLQEVLKQLDQQAQ